MKATGKATLTPRVFAIGDIHGCYAALLALCEELKFEADDVVVTLRDYVDRGPDSQLVIEHLIALTERTTLVPILGNHEIMMFGARRGDGELQDWRDSGGDATLRSYKSDTLEAVPASHWQFLKSRRPFYATDRDFFVHANAHPHLALTEQPNEMLYWEPLENPASHRSGRRMICGHTQQRNWKPRNLGHAVCIDTAAYAGGWLTCLEVGTGIYWQVNQFSQICTDAL